jgi:hypothetical protein
VAADGYVIKTVKRPKRSSAAAGPRIVVPAPAAG